MKEYSAEKIRNLEDELARYRMHLDSTLARIRDKGALAEALRDMGLASTPDEVKARLETLLKNYFPGAAVELRTGAPHDFADKWVAERKIPLLVRNSEADSRLPRGFLGAGERSFMALPLHLFGRLVGFVRAAAPEPDRFRAEDLRGAELACTLAGRNHEEEHLHMLLNMSKDPVEMELPKLPGRVWHRAIDTGQVSPADILEAARNSERIPSGITRHIIPNRALNINIPLEVLAADWTLEGKREWLQGWIMERMAANAIRYYAESTFSFDE